MEIVQVLKSYIEWGSYGWIKSKSSLATKKTNTRKCGEIENEFGKSKAMFIRLTLFLCSASTPKEQQTITGSLPRFLV